VPKGKFILVPALAQLVASTDGRLCDKLEADAVANNGANAIRSDFVSIDGQRFDALYDYRVHAPRCTTIRGSDGETVATNVVYYGTWVILQPLPEGHHTISFGGKLPPNLDRGVTYLLDVE
jgi:hypothetical protein